MKVREWLNFANVVAVLALVIAVAGTGSVAYAHGMIGSADIKNGAVKTQHLAKGAVTTRKVKKGAIKTGKIAPGAVTRGKIAPDAVTGAKVKDGSLGAEDLNATTQSGLNIAAAQVSGTSVTVTSWFNRQGGAPTVTRHSAGNYSVVFPGTNPTQASIVVVSSIFVNRTCIAGKAAGPAFFYVQCFRIDTGAHADSTFHLVHVN